MFRLATVPPFSVSSRLLSNIVVKPYFLNVNVRLNNSDSPSKSDSIYKSHLHAFVNILDTNGDGLISRKEIFEDVPRRFAATVGPPQETVDRFQANFSKMAKSMGMTEDMQISCDEYLAGARAALQNPEFVKIYTDLYNCVFDGLDKNGDGYIGPIEWVAFMNFFNYDPKDAEAAFKAIDKNGDGMISRDEFCSLLSEYWTSDEQPTLGSDKMFGNREPLDPPGRN